ncbi:hypothetical protein B0H19DRAFT_1132904 [Mycena capillaripes]|nr:hypothetical protein B0H19DRAFT_1132904 [Mycena capillaripes]
MESAVSFNVNTTIGALQIGVLVSYVLFGVTTTQTYIYYSRFPEDSRKLKALVGFVWLCELAQALCIGHVLYTYTISDYAHPERLLGAVPKSSAITVVFSAQVIACVQGFFSLRIYRLSNKMCIPVVIWVLVLTRLVMAIILFVLALEMKSLLGVLIQSQWLATSLWIISTASDLAITVTLVILLRKQRADVRTRTAVLVDKIILWTVETGMLTSAWGIATLICFTTMKTNFIWIGLFVVASRLFSNSLLASLNSRAKLRAMNEVSLPLSLHLTSTIGSPSANLQVTKITHIADDATPSSVQRDKAVSEEV